MYRRERKKALLSFSLGLMQSYKTEIGLLCLWPLLLPDDLLNYLVFACCSQQICISQDIFGIKVAAASLFLIKTASLYLADLV
jgi:hypothetical protein